MMIQPAHGWDPTQGLYEKKLADVYERLADLYAGHTQHPMKPSGRLRLVAPHDEHPAGHGLICKVNTRCDELADATAIILVEAFQPGDVGDLLDNVCPLFDIPFDTPVTTIRDACTEALRRDAERNRLFPRGAICPIDPEVTRP